MSRARPTVADLQAGKGQRQLTNVYVDSVAECEAAEEAGIDIITVQDSIMSPVYRDAAPTAFMVVGLDYGTIVTTDDYLRAAFRGIADGADACWSAASLETISRMRAEGIPVVGHVGLIPPRRTWTGGFKAVGKTASTARQVWEQTRALEEAGAFAAEIEVVPEAVATEISQRTSLVMISMGSGAGCDAQYLFSTDVLGTNTGHVPRHAKTYGAIGAELDRVQRLRVEAFKAYVDDVASGGFPDRSRLVPIDDAELEAFRRSLGS
ncbi:MAG: 3-methyl-2-oxobutanoate hydroxymethyltransferase [Acidimicrobiales bacterium]|nr:3-methyl-2-oxobutanoate hydroxymethyltransferase [Acidimicrobiales bacterium]